MGLYKALVQDKLSQIPLHFFVFTLLLMAAVLATGNSVRADEYLDVLKQESDDLQYLEGGKKQSTQKSVVKHATIGSFEKFIEGKDKALFTIYKELDTQKRLRIYNVYKITMDYSKAEQLIHELHISRE